VIAAGRLREMGNIVLLFATTEKKVRDPRAAQRPPRVWRSGAREVSGQKSYGIRLPARETVVSEHANADGKPFIFEVSKTDAKL
jgi:hypothetical protein